jgi:hypothetical protein
MDIDLQTFFAAKNEAYRLYRNELEKNVRGGSELMDNRPRRQLKAKRVIDVVGNGVRGYEKPKSIDS